MRFCQSSTRLANGATSSTSMSGGWAISSCGTIAARPTPAPTSRRRSDGCCGAAPSRASRCTNNMIGERAMSRLPVLEQFIGDLRALWAAEPDNRRRMEQAKPLLEQLLNDPGLRAHSAAWPSTEGYKNLLLYVDPDHHFV